jgi:hypothetical protein
MAKFNYARAQTTALRLIVKFGVAGTIIRDGPDWDPREPVPTPYACTLVVFEVR